MWTINISAVKNGFEIYMFTFDQPETKIILMNPTLLEIIIKCHNQCV